MTLEELLDQNIDVSLKVPNFHKERSLDDLAVISWTSGSTGDPKVRIYFKICVLYKL